MANTPAPLVGRDRELGLLREARTAALAGRGSLVLIGGEAGIGKTALAETVCREAADEGALVLTGRCYDLAETPPYGPWRELFARAPAGADLPPLPAALAPRGRAGAAPSTSTDALVCQVGDFLAALAARRPLVILLDDLHWADPASLDLLRAVARGPAAGPPLIMATYRADEVTGRHPLYQVIPALVREAGADRLDLRRLGAADVRALVGGRYRLAAADEDQLVAFLGAHAEGNPFYLGEFLRALTEDGVLRPGEGGGTLGDLAAVRVPALLRQIIGARLARLGDEAVRVLAVAAIIGQEFAPALWAAVAGVEEEATLDIAERAVEAHILAEGPRGEGLRFTHALVREALYEGLLAPRRQGWHRRAAEALAAAPAPDPDAVAAHFRRAGDARAAEWLVRAGECAQGAYAWLTAAERYEAALALGEGAGIEPCERARLLLCLAQFRRYGDPRRGSAQAAEAARLAAAAGDGVLAAAARFDEGHLRCLARDLRGGLPQMEAAFAALAAAAPAERARLPAPQIQGAGAGEDYHRGALVNWLAHAGRYAEALAAGATMAARGPGTTPRGLAGLANAYAALGRPDEARQALADARTAFAAAGQHHEAGQTWQREFSLIILPYEADGRAASLYLLDEAERAYVRADGALDHRASGWYQALHLDALWLDGRWEEAREAAARAGGMRAADILAQLGRARGDADAIGATVRAALPDGPVTTPGAVRFAPAVAQQRLAAGLALDAGDLDTARAWLEAHDRWLAWSGAVLGRADGQALWASYHRAAGDPAQAREGAARAFALASAPRQPLALLAAHRLLGELDAAAGRHDDAQGHLGAALALADACAAPYERALTLLALAELRAATGETDTARAALAEARAICAPLGAAPACARADALAARLALLRPPRPAFPAGLTAREVEVLRLVAAGRSNRAIAAAFTISFRTVERHIANIYAKIGASNRADATAFAFHHDLT